MKLYSINTGNFKLDGGAMFGVVPKSIWQKLNPPDANNLCSWTMRCLLIEDAGRLILVDNGIGDKQDEKFFSYYGPHGDDTLGSSLAKYGFHPNDITDVFLTHLHFDHCGGSIKREGDKLVPSFKNATYWSNEAHWQWAVKPNDREKASFLKENILPIKESGQLKMIKEEDGTSFSDNVKIRFVYGHTEAMMLPQVRYKGREIIFCADLFPSLAHIPMPYIMAYDVRPLETMNEKKKFFEEAVKGDYILFFEHDKQYECCDLQMTEKGVKHHRTFKLDEI